MIPCALLLCVFPRLKYCHRWPPEHLGRLLGAGAVRATQSLLWVSRPRPRGTGGAGADGRPEGVSLLPAGSEELVGDLGRAEDGGLRGGGGEGGRRQVLRQPEAGLGLRWVQGSAAQLKAGRGGRGRPTGAGNTSQTCSLVGGGPGPRALGALSPRWVPVPHLGSRTQRTTDLPKVLHPASQAHRLSQGLRTFWKHCTHLPSGRLCQHLSAHHTHVLWGQRSVRGTPLPHLQNHTPRLTPPSPGPRRPPARG